MNGGQSLSFRVASAAFAASLMFSGVGLLHAQTPTPPAAKAAPAEDDPFAPQPAPPLAARYDRLNDERSPRGLKPGLYDAGEAASGHGTRRIS